MVDTEGLVIKVVVHESGLRDRAGASLVLEELGIKYPRVAKIWADSPYRGLKEWMRTELGWELEVVRHRWSGRVWLRNDQEPPTRRVGFVALPTHWVVVRAFAWLARSRN